MKQDDSMKKISMPAETKKNDKEKKCGGNQKNRIEIPKTEDIGTEGKSQY